MLIVRLPWPAVTPHERKRLLPMSDSRVPLTGRSLRFAAGMFQDMARTRDAAACAREAGAGPRSRRDITESAVVLGPGGVVGSGGRPARSPRRPRGISGQCGAADRHQRVAGAGPPTPWRDGVARLEPPGIPIPEGIGALTLCSTRA